MALNIQIYIILYLSNTSKQVAHSHFLSIVEAPPPPGLIMGILDKIAEIEKEISKTQKNKATEYHLGCLKAKLAK